LQVRSSPRKARAKAPAAKKTKKQQTQFPSTNVPSPVRAKQKIRSFAYNEDDDEEDAFDAPRHPTRNKTTRGYQADGFVVDDDADGEFAPVREARTSRPAKPRGLGAPITEDERTAGLTGLQNDVLRDFVKGARNLRKSIEERKGHRDPIFTDTVLREMGLELPRNLDEMKTIPGIRPEMVDLYGKQFITLINNTRDFYGDETPVPRNQALRNRPAQRSRVVHDIEDEDEEVDDQNHRLVVDLCSDDEDIPGAAEAEEESDYSYGEDLDDDDDDDGVLQTSHFFSQAPNVVDFNTQFAQAGGGAAPSNKAAKAPAARGGKASGGGYKKRGSYKKRASGSGSKSFGGVKKRAPKTTGSRASGGAATVRKPSGGGGRSGGGGAQGGGAQGGWSSILAMPA
jgi:bloom syndrome protein